MWRPATHLLGRRVRVTQDGVRYIRRVVRTGGDADANAKRRETLRTLSGAPGADHGPTTPTEIVRHFATRGMEWFSVAAWAMKYRYQYGLGYPKGDTNWGKDAADRGTRSTRGRPTPGAWI